MMEHFRYEYSEWNRLWRISLLQMILRPHPIKCYIRIQRITFKKNIIKLYIFIGKLIGMILKTYVNFNEDLFWPTVPRKYDFPFHALTRTSRIKIIKDYVLAL